jgi:hypothetical protein
MTPVDPVPVPLPVSIAGVEPGAVAIPVAVVSGPTREGRATDVPRLRTITLSDGQQVASPTTTEEEDRGTAGQRAVNLLWENTQAKIAVAIVYVVLFVAGCLSLSGMVPSATDTQTSLAITAFMLLSSLSTLVIGFYYGRTNHTKVGGISAAHGR